MANSSIRAGMLLDGRYKLLRPLSGDGGTADVWLALDTNTIDDCYDDDFNKVASEDSGIKVAIKIYRPKNALDLGEQRFREEFKIVFNCHHTNLIQPINFSIYEGIPYLVLPYCASGSSESLQGKINHVDELWKYIADVSAGLEYLHDFNPTIVHHDIKPANILIDDSSNYAITDFGISAHSGFNREGYDDNHSGTMAYMAPERFNDDYESTPESDIWSFGATLYEIVTGKVPFGEDGGLAQAESGEACPTITQPIPSDIKRLIYDCLSLDRARRPSAAKINRAATLRQYPVKNRKWLFVGVVAAVLVAAVVAIVMATRSDRVAAALPAVSNEQRYEQAMALVNTPDPGLLARGLSMLDSLSASGYVPALYQQAYTYGWYSDSASVARKQLLGIEYSDDFLPKDKKINVTAIGLFSRIDDIGDPQYAALNAEALYRLALYYGNVNDVFQEDMYRAKMLLIKAREWAEQANDAALIERINRNLQRANQ